jgi:serine/threonine protein kinase
MLQKLVSHGLNKGDLVLLFILLLTSILVKSASGVSTIYKEATNLKKLRHKNIVELQATFVEGRKLVMVMEHAGGGELLEFL